ncbi:hypothetical protein [Streptomyces sp. NPDC004050]
MTRTCTEAHDSTTTETVANGATTAHGTPTIPLAPASAAASATKPVTTPIQWSHGFAVRESHTNLSPAGISVFGPLVTTPGVAGARSRRVTAHPASPATVAATPDVSTAHTLTGSACRQSA